MKRIDLNCDMGESFGAWKMGADAGVMPFISSANIACGFHAGDPATIRKTVRLAVDHGVAIGAHPSLPDLMGFGRRAMKISPQDMYDLVVYQAGAVEGFARAAGAKLHHIKCHGALYNMAANDEALSEAMVRAAKDLGVDIDAGPVELGDFDRIVRLDRLGCRCQTQCSRNGHGAQRACKA